MTVCVCCVSGERERERERGSAVLTLKSSMSSSAPILLLSVPAWGGLGDRAGATITVINKHILYCTVNFGQVPMPQFNSDLL